MFIDIVCCRNIFLMEVLWICFFLSICFFLELICKGEIGELVGVKVDFGFRFELFFEDWIFNKVFGGGVFLDIGIYFVFLVLLLFGKVLEIKVMVKIGSIGVDEDMYILFWYLGG